MDNFIKLPADERKLYFEQVANNMKLSPEIIEKDFWVCLTLQKLFSLSEIGNYLIFKGGTSLSKSYQVIKRFSEDIDVSIDRAFLGFDKEKDPEAGKSNKEKQRRLESLKISCQNIVKKKIQPLLNKEFSTIISKKETWSLILDSNDPDLQTLIFNYPTAFIKQATSYLMPSVKIEMGARSDHWPNENKSFSSLVAQMFPQVFKNPSIIIKTLSIERTFWEKALILHAEYHRPLEKITPPRLSRQYYDIYQLYKQGFHKKAMEQKELLKRVAEHKTIFFRSSWAKYLEAYSDTIHIAPRMERISDIEEDYKKMEIMFFEKPPEFSDILNSLKDLESMLNNK